MLNKQNTPNYNFFTHGKNKQLINSNSILYLQCIGGYVTIFLKDGAEIIERKLLKRFEQELSKYGFIRISHNTLINSIYVTKLELATIPKKIFLNDIELKITRRKGNFVKRKIFG